MRRTKFLHLLKKREMHSIRHLDGGYSGNLRALAFNRPKPWPRALPFTSHSEYNEDLDKRNRAPSHLLRRSVGFEAGPMLRPKGLRDFSQNPSTQGSKVRPCGHRRRTSGHSSHRRCGRRPRRARHSTGRTWRNASCLRHPSIAYRSGTRRRRPDQLR